MTGRAALVFGLSEAASATAHLLHRHGWAVALAADAPPKVHRRRMSFADVWWDKVAVLDGIACRSVAPDAMRSGEDPQAHIAFLAVAPDVALDLMPWSLSVDARLAKRAAPLRLLHRAPLTMGCGPGHVAGQTCDLAIETQWGDRLGAVIEAGPTAPLAGEPRSIEGVGRERIVYAPVGGVLRVLREIGDPVTKGEVVARIGPRDIVAPIGGTLRGMLREGLEVAPGDKLLEVDPRPAHLAIFTGIGQRPAMIAEGVARAIARVDAEQAIGLPPPATVPDPTNPSSKERETTMKLSARNVLKGRAAGIEPGAVTTIIRIDLGGGVIVASSITKAAADDLNLAVGDEAFAVIKASDVLVGKP